MLTSLVVKNYALIKDLDIDFESGFSIITGETGAGKSILLGALSLLLGQRADTSVLSIPDKKCIVEGNFSIRAYELKNFFIDNDVDYDEHTIIRREINPNGKSRAFVNDVPVTLNVLKTLGDQLVDIHSQHQTLNLGDNRFQLQVVDMYAGNEKLLSAFSAEFKKLGTLRKEYKSLIEAIERFKEEKDFLQFQYDELEKLKLKPQEEEELEKEFEKLSHAEEIRLNLEQASDLLTGEHVDTLSKLKEALQAIQKTGAYLPEMAEINERMESVYLELKDISLEIDHKASSITVDPHQLEFVRERMDSLNRLLMKYQVKTASELISIRDETERKLQNIEDSDFHKDEVLKKINDQETVVEKLATQLDENRKTVIPDVEKTINVHLKLLGMPEGVFKVKQNILEELTSEGKSNVTFLFSANSGSDVKELSKVASGGELSRLMLSLKSLMAEKVKLPTIVFDEIDAGVSGEVADKVGNIIRRMAENRQVFNITHLPQVASKGEYHYKVFKENLNGEVSSRIKLLSPEERRTEIAQMLSGEDLSEAAYKNADELLNRNK